MSSAKRPKDERGGTRKKRGSYHHGDLRRALLREALLLVEAEGPEALRLRELARRLGVTHAACYRHFDNRGALVLALAVEGYEQLAKEMNAAAALTDDDPVERWRAMGSAYVRFAQKNAAYFRLMFSREAFTEPLAEQVRRAAQPSFGLILQQVMVGQRRGLVRPGPPSQLATTAWAALHGLVSMWDMHLFGALEDALPTREVMAREVMEILYSGLVSAEAREDAELPFAADQSVAVSVLRRVDGRLLMVPSTSGDEAADWKLPSTRMLARESAEDAAVRTLEGLLQGAARPSVDQVLWWTRAQQVDWRLGFVGFEAGAASWRAAGGARWLTLDMALEARLFPATRSFLQRLADG